MKTLKIMTLIVVLVCGLIFYVQSQKIEDYDFTSNLGFEKCEKELLRIFPKILELGKLNEDDLQIQLGILKLYLEFGFRVDSWEDYHKNILNRFDKMAKFNFETSTFIVLKSKYLYDKFTSRRFNSCDTESMTELGQLASETISKIRTLESLDPENALHNYLIAKIYFKIGDIQNFQKESLIAVEKYSVRKYEFRIQQGVRTVLREVNYPKSETDNLLFPIFD